MAKKNFDRKTRVMGLALLAALPLASGIFCDTRADGLRLSVNVSEPFEFQGRIWPASKLSVVPREVTYSPTSTLDEIWIGTECLGRLFADRQAAATSPDQDVVFFERNADQRLVLVGYALRGSNESFRYRPGPAAAATRTAGSTADGRTGVASLR